MSMKTGLKDKGWEQTQIKVFSRWANKYLKERGMTCDDITKDLGDGTRLINLLEVVGKEEIGGKYHKTPKMRFHMLENNDLAIRYITEKKGVRLTGISSIDIVDCNAKLTLGLIWSVINKFIIEEISVEEATARDALLLWCKKNTQGYEDVNVTNFTSSWSSGLAFCALINKFRPNLLDYNALDRTNHTECCIKAFDACKELGLTVYLDPEDLVDVQPDEKSVVTQVSEFFQLFANESKVEAMAQKVQNTVAMQMLLDELTSNYAAEAAAAIKAMDEEHTSISSFDYEKTVPGTKEKLVTVIKYGRVSRPQIVELRGKAMKTWTTLLTKSKASSRPVPVPPAGLEPETLTSKFNELEALAKGRKEELQAELKAIKEKLINEFDEKCNESLNKSNTIMQQAQNLNGTLAEQKDTLVSYLEEAQENEKQIEQIKPLHENLIELKLNSRSKNTLFSVSNTASQLVNQLNRLIEQNKAASFEEQQRAKIDSYNAVAIRFDKEANEFEESIEKVEGSIVEQRSTFFAKQEELKNMREVMTNELGPIYAELEKEGIHLGLEHTPGSINSHYASILTSIQNKINSIFQQMIEDYNTQVDALIDRCKELENKADALPEDFDEQKEGLLQLQQEAENMAESIPKVEEPFAELTQFNLHFKANFSKNDVAAQHAQTIAFFKHMIMNNETQSYEQKSNTLITAYNQASGVFAQAATEIENAIANVDGSLEQKREAIMTQKNLTVEKAEQVKDLIPQYEELEQKELHIEIEYTPDSLTTFFSGIQDQCETHIREIDSAIAAAKGLQISEEQLAEFRETFNFFDKDKSNSLEYFELKACLTALGETSTDEECKAIISKYTEGTAESLDFDRYAKFMLDRFSKEETAESTKDAFKAISQNSEVVTEEQLARFFTPEQVEYMKSKIPQAEGGYAYAQWADSLFNQ